MDLEGRGYLPQTLPSFNPDLTPGAQNMPELSCLRAKFTQSLHRRLCMMSRSKRFSSPLIGLFLTFLLLALGGCSLLSPADAPISGKITISGSTALLPFAQRAAQDFQKLHPKVTLDVQGGGSFTHGLRNELTQIKDRAHS